VCRVHRAQLVLAVKMSVVYYIATLFFTTELVMATTEQCGVYEFKSPFYPGESCEDIYNKNTKSHERSGYYWITDGHSRIYCRMTYTGSSCEDIYYNNPETGEKSGYYRINGNQWTYCNMTAIATLSPHVLVWVEHGRGWSTLISVQEITVPVDGAWQLTLVLVSVV